MRAQLVGVQVMCVVVLLLSFFSTVVLGLYSHNVVVCVISKFGNQTGMNLYGETLGGGENSQLDEEQVNRMHVLRKQTMTTHLSSVNPVLIFFF